MGQRVKGRKTCVRRVAKVSQVKRSLIFTRWSTTVERKSSSALSMVAIKLTGRTDIWGGTLIQFIWTSDRLVVSCVGPVSARAIFWEDTKVFTRRKEPVFVHFVGRDLNNLQLCTDTKFLATWIQTSTDILLLNYMWFILCFYSVISEWKQLCIFNLIHILQI